MYRKYIKRLLDIIFSIILIILLFPIMIIVGLICKIQMKHIIFKQRRVGKNKQVFTIYKFQSMKDLKGDYYKRTTKTTRILRNIGLDELPQLFNILKGDMSFVGPRPFIENEKLPPEKIDDIMYSVLPGVTGLASAMGRRTVGHHQRLLYDYEYARKLSFLLDIKIIILTIKVLILQNFKR